MKKGSDTLTYSIASSDICVNRARRLADGHTMQIDEEYLRFRAPNEEEEFLQSGAELLVVETITSDEINPLKR